MGTLAVLNTGKGDMTITFDTSNVGETIRARRVITDMLRRGYALVVKQGDTHVPVSEFDEKSGEYTIVDFDPESGGKVKKRIASNAAEATAIAPTAGG